MAWNKVLKDLMAWNKVLKDRSLYYVLIIEE